MKMQVLDHKATGAVLERLMGKDLNTRFNIIPERAEYAELDIWQDRSGNGSGGENGRNSGGRPTGLPHIFCTPGASDKAALH